VLENVNTKLVELLAVREEDLKDGCIYLIDKTVVWTLSFFLPGISLPPYSVPMEIIST